MKFIVVIAPATSWRRDRGFRHAVLPGKSRALCGKIVEDWYEDAETIDGVEFEAGKVGCRACVRSWKKRYFF